MAHILSKSKYIRGLQCVRALYFDVYCPKAARYSAETLAKFRGGRDFERRYKSLFADGIDISRQLGSRMERYPSLTMQLLLSDGDVTLFEAGFLHDGVLILADVVRKSADGGLIINEVKNSTAVSDTFRRDVALQHYVVSHAIADSGLMLNEFSVVYNDGSDGFLTLDLMDESRAEHPTIAANIERFKDVLQDFEPQVEPGDQCTTPYECPYRHLCQRKSH